MNVLEHVNITVDDPKNCAALITDIFGWVIRWEGKAKDGGYSIHVGNEFNGETYLVFYSHPNASRDSDKNPLRRLDATASGFLNHIGILVDDLDRTEQRVADAGLTPMNHADYEPGRRFYFFLPDNLEVEVISYEPEKNVV